MCPLRNIAMRDYQESVTTGQTHGRTDRQTDKVIPMCRYASQETQKWDSGNLEMTNLHTDEIAFFRCLTKIGTDENKAIYSIT